MLNDQNYKLSQKKTIYLMRKSEGISQVIRYQQQLKAKIQQTDNLIMQGGLDKQQLADFNELLKQEDIIVRYIEVQSAKMQPEVRNIYAKNITRFKKKIKQQKEFINSQFGPGATKKYHDPYNVAHDIKIQQQNLALIGNKQAMYQNQQLQNNIGRDVQQQGTVLQGNINRNRQIRQEASESSNAIKQIHKAILKRKIMFYSIFVLFGLAMVFVIIRKFTKAK